MPNLVGIGLSQVPTNSMLGGLAYQSPDHASIKDLDLKNLSQINSEIADTAVDIFIYDTSKDSDGGAWRKRTTHTSWYNETLGTATRGTRREFPSVAVIVAESTQLTIYDGDDPDLPMWMVFDRASSAGWTPNDTNILGVSYSTFTSISMLNGIFAMGADYDSDNSNGVLIKVSFIEDTGYFHGVNSVSSSYPAGGFGRYSGSIAERDSGKGHFNINDTDKIVNVHVNDVAMTVLPNAPIDDATGLPVPTIAVATAGGVSVIRDDGDVYDIVGSNADYRKNLKVAFTTDNKIIYTEQRVSANEYGWMYVHDVPTEDTTITVNGQDTALNWFDTRTTQYMYEVINTASDGHISVAPGSNQGIGLPLKQLTTGDDHIFVSADGDSGFTTIEENRTANMSNLICHRTSSYITGWLHGRCVGAFLADTDTTDAAPGSNLISASSADFTSSSGWTLGTGWTISGGKLNKTTTDNTSAYYSFTGLTVGKAYTFSMDVDTVGSGSVYFYALGQYAYWPTLDTTGTHSLTVVADATSLDFGVTGLSGNGAVLDNASLTIGEADRSGSNEGLEVLGTVTKSAVATDAELVAYSGFSGSNVLVQPYNSNLDPGTGDYSFACWFKCSSTGGEQMIMRRFGVPTVTGGMMLRIVQTSSVLQWYVRDTSSTATAVNSTMALDDGNWHCAVGTREGSTARLYIDGKLNASSGCSANSHNPGTTADLVIGAEESGANPGTYQNPADLCSLALLRYSRSAPSAAQVKKMYEDEKVLFQENAACTLYGSSDAVTALAYDEVTERLHVGTSSGRSDFQGLRRINNTTTAVTTAISAHDEFIVEQ